VKVSLTVLERLLVLNLLPAENNITTLRVIRKLKDKIGFTEEESKALNFKILDGPAGKGSTTTWNQTAVGEVEFEIGEKSEDLIKDALKELNDAKPKGKLTEQHLSLWDKFVEPLHLEPEEKK